MINNSLLSKITASIRLPNDIPPKRAFFLTAEGIDFVIHLESAAVLFHITGATQGITGSLRAACSEPVQRFLACPFS
jgi:hypothetical protein